MAQLFIKLKKLGQKVLTGQPNPSKEITRFDLLTNLTNPPV